MFDHSFEQADDRSEPVTKGADKWWKETVSNPPSHPSLRTNIFVLFVCGVLYKFLFLSTVFFFPVCFCRSFGVEEFYGILPWCMAGKNKGAGLRGRTTRIIGYESDNSYHSTAALSHIRTESYDYRQKTDFDMADNSGSELEEGELGSGRRAGGDLGHKVSRQKVSKPKPPGPNSLPPILTLAQT